MISKSKYLAVALAGLAILCSGKVMAADQLVSQQGGTQPTSKWKNQKKANTPVSMATYNKKNKCVQEQTPPGKNKPVGIQCQQPRSKTPISQKPVQQQCRSKGKQVTCGQTQRPSRPGVKYVSNRQQSQLLQQ
jgi:hypothetical protein